MYYHVCKFSKVVSASYQVPAPREDPEGFITEIMNAIHASDIDLVIPMHEEIFFLAEAAQTNEELRRKLLAPDFRTLVTLHNKWQFSRFLSKLGLRVPTSRLCRTYECIQDLDQDKEWALKPVYGRAASNVFHLKPGKPLPGREEIDVSEETHYIAQEWTKGQRYCTYSVLQDGRVAALAAYPVKDTIDGKLSRFALVVQQTYPVLGSSCVYFESIEKESIRDYMGKLAAGLPGVSGQIALDLIELDDGSLVAIECNPRATSGIHLYSGTAKLALALTCRCPVDEPASDNLPDHVAPPPRAKRKVAPGMLMWKPFPSDQKTWAIVGEYAGHMKRLVASRDVIWSWRDLLPSLMQPFLLTSYYEICREKGLKLPTMFQYDLVWEPKGDHLRRVRELFTEEPEPGAS
ncbi:carbamoylphosphate synthase large subunit [Coprinopsis cinerea okayama7|uniref:Carbamoylphosphate synthase large subunit n=1 Tax=Coprinopsis cinerea (strain Okayama-7 / 130 / ATCC MYA-4618 / FGSC 9003) TaxID=240176 RepID=A8PB98_COPC7|nr:carbamoylphosphate synthase large subunit [Coprinopsis cinerea okayama7\|eukprot:XP_001840131.2 carbamoylphosphate synthase large subunit [Coprinopsis cinerea okayama7\